MRGKVAKRIRKEVYQGKGTSREFREYFARPVYKNGKPTATSSDTIVADQTRNLYQQMKQQWTRQGSL